MSCHCQRTRCRLGVWDGMCMRHGPWVGLTKAYGIRMSIPLIPTPTNIFFAYLASGSMSSAFKCYSAKHMSSVTVHCLQSRFPGRLWETLHKTLHSNCLLHTMWRRSRVSHYWKASQHMVWTSDASHYGKASQYIGSQASASVSTSDYGKASQY